MTLDVILMLAHTVCIWRLIGGKLMAVATVSPSFMLVAKSSLSYRLLVAHKIRISMSWLPSTQFVLISHTGRFQIDFPLIILSLI